MRQIGQSDVFQILMDFDLESFDEAWQDWFLSQHEFALRDEEFFKKESGSICQRSDWLSKKCKGLCYAGCGIILENKLIFRIKQSGEVGFSNLRPICSMLSPLMWKHLLFHIRKVFIELIDCFHICFIVYITVKNRVLINLSGHAL